jgi:hypothetical protein
MDIVSPVITFDIGALAPTNPHERAVLSAAIEDSTDYISDILDPQFEDFVKDIENVVDLKESIGQSISIVDCLLVFGRHLNYEKAIELFNYDEDGDAYIFFDKIYYCTIKDDDLQYPAKYDLYMKNYMNSIKKVHKAIQEDYEEGTVDQHILIFTNFFITIRNKPFARWKLKTDKNGNVVLNE